MKKVVVEEIKDPQFLSKMSFEELEETSKEIREYIIKSVAKTGGHLSSNLGIVDLTIALHKVFNFTKDKIIFDVGHQSYTHKILTGRAKKFKSLRKYKGLSGFQSLNEGDDYEAGHSSTSLSAALGFAVSRDLSNKKHNVIAVIGDGSIGNGISYEALNHIGSLNTKLIVVLNDNEMSISQNVGGLHNALDVIRSTMEYNNTKKSTKNIFKKIPFVGSKFVSLFHNVKVSMKKFYIKEGSFFEDLGFRYYGPINGHDYKEMELYFKIAKKSKKPVLLHVITEKGKGYKYAEGDKKGIWHGTPPFDIETGTSSQKLIWADAISEFVLKKAKCDKRIITVTPAMTSGSKLTKIKETLPKQFIDVGIAEEHALVFSNALALDGKKPFVSIYSSFLQRGYDQVIHDIAKMKTSVVVGVDRCGVIGEDGASHQGLYDISFLLPIPNIVICCPKDVKEANSLLELGFSISLPFFIRYSKDAITLNDNVEKIKLGSWEKIKTGTDATIITYGDFVNNAILISEKLNKLGYKIEVVNARFIKPIDLEMFENIKSKNIFVYEEATKIGSLGSYLSTIKNVDIIAVKDEFIEHGRKDEILKSLRLDIDSVSEYILNKLKKTS